jgi:uncharacterized protein (TIGR02265 family)
VRSAPPPFHEFAEPNVHAPFAVREMIAAAPADIGVRGVYFNFIGDELARIGHSEPQRIAFKWYPLRELMELEVRAASLLHPHVPVREGLRRVARISYTSLVSTTVGRVLFSVAGLDFRVALTLTSKAYALSMNRGTCEMLELHKGWARAALRDIHNFVDSSQVGVFEGAMEAYGVEGRVLVRPIDQANADFLIEWT